MHYICCKWMFLEILKLECFTLTSVHRWFRLWQGCTVPSCWRQQCPTAESLFCWLLTREMGRKSCWIWPCQTRQWNTAAVTMLYTHWLEFGLNTALYRTNTTSKLPSLSFLYFVGASSLSLQHSIIVFMISKLFRNTLRLSWWVCFMRYSSRRLAR